LRCFDVSLSLLMQRNMLMIVTGKGLFKAAFRRNDVAWARRMPGSDSDEQ
jgi:hypothetical protein